ncbi:OmpA family protein [Algoriphagus sp. H41]|uniref:OmpA family protein n=1 Tax=Algoriphagus oliviformis TaxID=2811231 RepID=A0ABS3C8S2_9BACT|nr:OmpA family protein [Algoriphagus oliviformis]MBN7812560.1 OmpA family protein [Algoriphagus oliviformis]
MKKSFILLLLFGVLSPLVAQQYGYKWRVGLSAGTTNYYGDIQPMGLNSFKDFTKLYDRYEHYAERLSYQGSIEYALGNSVGLMLSAGSYQFGSGDRFVENDGSLYADGENFDRALNFQTKLLDAGLSLVLKPDNNWLLPGRSFFAPYLTLGAGYQSFSVFGDLLDANGSRYDYRNASVIPDGTFETKLSDLDTEVAGGYSRSSFYTNVGLGFRIRLGKGLELFAQSDFKRAFSDYLDDVSGTYRSSYDNDFQEYAALPGTNVPTVDQPYRGNPDGEPDWYIYHGIGIKFSFGANKKSFTPPTMSQQLTYVPPRLSQKESIPVDTISTETPKPASEGTVNYFTVIQLPGWQKASPQGTSAQDSAALAEMALFRDSIATNREEIQRGVAQATEQIEGIEASIGLALEDSTLTDSVRQSRIQALENERTVLMGNITSLTFLDAQLQAKQDSLDSISKATLIVPTDTAKLVHQLLIYPGQMGKILYLSSGDAEIHLQDQAADKDSVQRSAYRMENADSTRQALDSAKVLPNVPSPAALDTTGLMTREDFDAKMDQFRTEMLQSQAERDSAIITSLASIAASPQPAAYQSTSAENPPADLAAVDEKTRRKVQKNRQKQESLEEKNNNLLKGALIAGGAAATTAAISSSGKRKRAEEQAAVDSLLISQIQADSILIDSLQRLVLEPRLKVQPDTVFLESDTVFVEKMVDSLTYSLLSEIEVYFGINQSTLTDEEKEKLQEVKELAEAFPNLKLDLRGYADNTGSIAYNLQISEKRVNAVRDHLISIGIEASKISSNVGGLIIRGKTKGSVDSDRKVEVRFREKPVGSVAKPSPDSTSAPTP